MELVLASGSDRRRILLSWLGVPFKVVISDIDEVSIKEMDSERLVRQLAVEKAKAVAERMSDPSTVWNHTGSRRAQGDKRDLKSLSRLSRMHGSGLLVIGADTVGFIDGEILGKPKDTKDAFRMLKKLSGRKHWVYTGVAVVRASRPDLEERKTESLSAVEKTAVTFRKLSDKEIQDYVDSGEPLDKGASYAIQMGAAGFITKVEGSYTNVVGLPLVKLAELMEKMGLSIDKDVGRIVFEKTGYRS